VATPVLIRAVPWVKERKDNAEHLRWVTGGEIVWDRNHDPTETMIDALRTAARYAAWNGTGTIHIEDDAYLTDWWRWKVENCLLRHPHQVVQWFSMRRSDLDLGSREEPCRTFASTLCFYVPARLAACLAEAVEQRPLRQGDPRGKHSWDYAMADHLASLHERYHLHVPSLAQHYGTWKSVVNPRRARGRKSPSFEP
jgi:hypothetical protein